MSQASMTLAELAISKGKTTAQAGVCQSYFIDLCKGRREVGANAIQKIADALGEPPAVVYAAIRASGSGIKRKRRARA